MEQKRQADTEETTAVMMETENPDLNFRYKAQDHPPPQQRRGPGCPNYRGLYLKVI